MNMKVVDKLWGLGAATEPRSRGSVGIGAADRPQTHSALGFGRGGTACFA